MNKVKGILLNRLSVSVYMVANRMGLFTARIRRLGEGTVFTGVCLSTGEGKMRRVLQARTGCPSPPPPKTEVPPPHDQDGGTPPYSQDRGTPLPSALGYGVCLLSSRKRAFLCSFRVSFNPFRTAVPAEGTYKHYIVLTSMANYNIRRKLPILPEMV